MAFKLDLHTHTVGSPDGSLNTAHIRRAFDAGRLHCIAITDHDTVKMAQKMQRQFGAERIIIGEEITTAEGEIIGLFLKEAVPPGLSAGQTAAAIKKQGGLVYIPHPFETVRKGLRQETLDAIAADVDVVETHNGRAIFQNFSRQAMGWAEKHQVAPAASSDAHGRAGWGRTYSIVRDMPTRRTLVALLKDATLERGTVGIRGVLYPKLNRIRKRRRD